MSNGIAVIDAQLRVVFWNKWLAEHSMISSEAAKGRELSDIFPNLRKSKFITKTRQVFATGRPLFFKNKIYANPFPFYAGRSYIKGKLAPMEQTVIISPLKDTEGHTEQALITVFDISDWITDHRILLESKEEMERLSHTDDLTQISNRRNISDRLAEEFSTHRRKKRPMSVAMLDIDHFKKINDVFGHQCGDMVLHETAQLMSDLLRDYDAIGRYGGEEFLIILPETTSAQAFAVCDRIRLTVQDHIYLYNGRELQITVSIGIASTAVADAITSDKLIAEADQCLYLAKDSGRNRTMRQEETPL